MFRRPAEQLVTGPAAFLLAGIIDLFVFSAQALRRTARRRLRGARVR